MRKTSIQKLQAAGYSFLRLEVNKQAAALLIDKPAAIIKVSSEFGVWRNLNQFNTIAEAEKELKRLVEKENLKYLY